MVERRLRGAAERQDATPRLLALQGEEFDQPRPLVVVRHLVARIVSQADGRTDVAR